MRALHMIPAPGVTGICELSGRWQETEPLSFAGTVSALKLQSSPQELKFQTHLAHFWAELI